MAMAMATDTRMATVTRGHYMATVTRGVQLTLQTCARPPLDLHLHLRLLLHHHHGHPRRARFLHRFLHMDLHPRQHDLDNLRARRARPAPCKAPCKALERLRAVLPLHRALLPHW